MHRIRLLVALAAVSALAVGRSSPGQDVRFAQITDVHIFDAAGKDTDDPVENLRGLEWVVDEINRRNEAGPRYDFVAFTGDLGLEAVLKEPVLNSGPALKKLSKRDSGYYGRLYEELDKSFTPDQNAALLRDIDHGLDGPVGLFARLLSRSKVRRWVFVPGNNDLLDEMPVTVYGFHRFVKLLQDALSPSKVVVDLTRPGGGPTHLTLGNCHFFGFDNSSFKNNYTDEYLDMVRPVQEGLVKALADEVGRVGARAEDGSKSFVYVFCHIPDINDPYLQSHNDPWLKDYLAKRSSPNRTNRKYDSPYPRSAWTVSSETRRSWDTLIKQGYVKKVFTGHFHSPDRSRYESLGWVESPEYPSIRLDKLSLCPPVAVKNQVKEFNSPQRGARGFRDVTVRNDTGDIVSTCLVWLYESPYLPAQPLPAPHAPSKGFFAYPPEKVYSRHHPVVTDGAEGVSPR
jgi:3',5'-cyclic AMP phosphodiesterase CpdA